MPITHSFVSAKSDGGDATVVRPGDWNASHVGGVSWTQVINQSGASFSGWTIVAGSWASDGTIIQKTNVTSAHQTARFDTKQPFGFGVIAEVEMRQPTSGQGTGSAIQGQLRLGSDGAGGNGEFGLVMDTGTTDGWSVEKATLSTVKKWSQTINYDTWYKVRVVLLNFWATVYLDGVLLGTSPVIDLSSLGADYLSLGNFNSKVDFRNIKMWVLSGDAPA